MIYSFNKQLSNTNIQYLSAEEDGKASSKPIMIMLHGFPENSWSWEHYIEAMSGHYSIFAPDLPGYNSSTGFKETQQYNIANLVETMAEFIRDIAGIQKVHLVAHDWGGVIAWPLVAFHESLFKKLTILNAAHPATFTREMANNPKQQANSDYITDLISETAYTKTSNNEHYMLKRLYGGWFKKLTQVQQSALVKQWDNQHAMEQSFAYYKNMPQLVTKRLSLNTEVKIPNIRIKVPTQVLWGMRDTAFVPEVLDGMEQWVEDLVVYRFDDADHWLHHQKLESVQQRLTDFHQ
ncbi:alpha/beta hydrolase [Glaciecola sp. XM2]|uniref:alpha/beta fold hydrolase n=1 Tax=Glaciecola sp. XM2 TaxID=1914931 RepID=UPI001BDE8379|nr:alpha/beta hydrolase [Glaciecola sp. XM2]MBT1449431.1 alpha/beta hydrolase [Glaciecola sp. XM2]